MVTVVRRRQARIHSVLTGSSGFPKKPASSYKKNERGFKMGKKSDYYALLFWLICFASMFLK